MEPLVSIYLGRSLTSEDCLSITFGLANCGAPAILSFDSAKDDTIGVSSNEVEEVVHWLVSHGYRRARKIIFS